MKNFDLTEVFALQGKYEEVIAIMNNLDFTEVFAQPGKHDEIIRKLTKNYDELIQSNEDQIQWLKVANVDHNVEFWELLEQSHKHKEELIKSYAILKQQLTDTSPPPTNPGPRGRGTCCCFSRRRRNNAQHWAARWYEIS